MKPCGKCNKEVTRRYKCGRILLCYHCASDYYGVTVTR